MGKLTNQYIDALQKWGELTGNPTGIISAQMLILTGGQWAVTKSTGSSMEGLREQVSLENTKRSLELLQQKTGLSEVFLIVGFIRTMEDWLRVDFETHEEANAERDARPDDMRRIANDPLLFEDYKKRVEASKQELIDQGITPKEEEVTPEKLLELADWLEDQRNRDPGGKMLGPVQAEENLNIWREVMAPILDAKNLNFLK